MSKRRTFPSLGGAASLVCIVAAAASAQTVTYENGQNGAPNGGQVNISGATLFVDFYNTPASTNDFINANGNTVSRPAPCSDTVPYATFIDTNCDGTPDNNGAALCDDAVACTVDLCNGASGCDHTANNGLCNDSNPCTDDSCNSGTGCV